MRVSGFCRRDDNCCIQDGRAVYAIEIGLDASSVAIYLVMGILGGALIQIPAGYITDRFNRRYVLIGFSIAAVFVCLVTGFSAYGAMTPMFGYIMAFLFGAVTMPITQSAPPMPMILPAAKTLCICRRR